MRSAIRSLLVWTLVVSFLCAGVVALGAPSEGLKLPTVVAKAKRLTRAEVEAATTPPSGDQLMAIVRTSSRLSAGVKRVAPTMGLDATKLLAPKAAVAGGARPPLPRYELPPCDWDAGIWLTLKNPLAAPSWPADEWVVMVPYGMYIPSSELQYSATQEELASWLPSSGLVMMLGALSRGKVCVHMRPPEAGLYLMVVHLTKAPSSRSDFTMRSTGLVESSVEGKKLVLLMRVDNAGMDFIRAYAGSYYEIEFATTQQYSWSFGGVSVKRIRY